MKKTAGILILTVIVSIVILYPDSVFGQNGKKEQKNLFFMAIEARIRVLERRYNVKFDPSWLPQEKIFFEIPKDADTERRKNFFAEYRPETQELFFKPEHRRQEIKLYHFEEDIMVNGLFRNKFREVFDHELGHLLADIISRRLGRGHWPNHNKVESRKWEIGEAVNIISEGIGTFFEYTSVFGEIKVNDRFLPESSNDRRWYSTKDLDEIKYHGGYWLVRPIIKAFRERGIIYLISNPFVLNDNPRAAARQYRDKAIEELSQK